VLTGKAVYTAHRRRREEKRPKSAGTAFTGTNLERQQQTDPAPTDYSAHISWQNKLEWVF